MEGDVKYLTGKEVENYGGNDNLSFAYKGNDILRIPLKVESLRN
jgi:hypothetical protein